VDTRNLAERRLAARARSPAEERENESSVFGSDEIHGLRIEKEEESEGGKRKNREKRCEIFVFINYDSQIILTILLLGNADRSGSDIN
jgi:hypothetical protein